MQLKHQLSLPSDTWNNLISSLSHVSEARQQRVDAFLKEISNDVQVICDCDNILVQSNKLDENAILALLQPRVDSPTGGSHSYSIQVHLSVFILLLLLSVQHISGLYLQNYHLFLR